jgi:hypothetical protein
LEASVARKRKSAGFVPSSFNSPRYPAASGAARAAGRCRPCARRLQEERLDIMWLKPLGLGSLDLLANR